MAAPEQEAKPEAVTASPAREPQPDPELDAPSAAAVAGQELQPWEQHAAVINLPRYDYRASGSLLLRSCSGFLITCPIMCSKKSRVMQIEKSLLKESKAKQSKKKKKENHLKKNYSRKKVEIHTDDTKISYTEREKSATKEAISILDKYIGNVNVLENLEPCDLKIAAKKRKLCSETTENMEEAVINEHTDASDSIGCIGNSNSTQSNTSEDVDKTSKLSLVKLSRSGLLFFKFPSGGFHVVQMLTEIVHSLKSGQHKSPQWCHRIFPIQETCVLSETELHATVSKLFRDFLRSKKDHDGPIKFAVAYNRRGIDETEMKPPKNSNEGSNQQALMDRDQCFKIVATAVKSIAEKSVVDLKSPEVAILIEMLPLSGVPLGSSVAGVSVLPAELVSTKPRLCVRSLLSDAKTTKKK